MIGGLLEMNTATNAAVLFFLQLAVILGACAVMRFVMIRIGQAPVIGEMIAGVLLGPSLLGAFAPETSQWLFPPESKPTLYAIASLGLTLYMFIVGMEFRTELFAKRIFTALSISLAGIVAPFLLGIFLAIWLQKEGGFFSASLSTPVASIFIGAALSITAFPMLARIIVENGLSGSLSGTIALAAGSIDDVVAWILLAVVLGAVSGNPMVIALVFVGAILYVAVCLLLIKPLIRFLRARVASEAELFSLMLLLLALGASFTDLVGLYSVLGAFFLGLVIPRDGLVEQFTAKIGPLTSAILLPFFFHLFWAEYPHRATRLALALGGLSRRGSAGHHRKTFCMLRSSQVLWNSSCRLADYRLSDECPGSDGTHSFEHRPAGGDHHPHPFHYYGFDGCSNHPDGYSIISFGP